MTFSHGFSLNTKKASFFRGKKAPAGASWEQQNFYLRKSGISHENKKKAYFLDRFGDHFLMFTKNKENTNKQWS